MTDRWSHYQFSLVILLGLLAAPAAFADGDGPRAETVENGLAQLLQGKTLAFVDPKSGIRHQVYFGRFGDDYERYVPCTISDGTWNATAQGEICLTDRLPPRAQICFKPVVSKQSISLSWPNGGSSHDAALYPGYQLPHG